MMDGLTLKYRKHAIKACLRSLPRRLAYITVSQAGGLLVKMGRGQEKVWGLSEGAASFEWTVDQFRVGVTKAYFADEVCELEFYGGPPGRLALRRGTFLTLLMDRLLIELYRGGFNALDGILPLQENYASRPRQLA